MSVVVLAREEPKERPSSVFVPVRIGMRGCELVAMRSDG